LLSPAEDGINDRRYIFVNERRELTMLTGKQKRFLRGLGHSLNPVITVGKGEISDSLIMETGEALSAHELIKVRILESCMLDRKEVAELLADGCLAEVAQILGRTILLYRKAKEPKLELPKESKVAKAAKGKN
jgi:RNA-binding protein